MRRQRGAKGEGAPQGRQEAGGRRRSARERKRTQGILESFSRISRWVGLERSGERHDLREAMPQCILESFSGISSISRWSRGGRAWRGQESALTSAMAHVGGRRCSEGSICAEGSISCLGASERRRAKRGARESAGASAGAGAIMRGTKSRGRRLQPRVFSLGASASGESRGVTQAPRPCGTARAWSGVSFESQSRVNLESQPQSRGVAEEDWAPTPCDTDMYRGKLSCGSAAGQLRIRVHAEGVC